jgi:methylated-DNA-[protein]-cysteine S-methyltransferase
MENTRLREAAKRSAIGYATMVSPVGELLLAGDDRGLRLVSFENGRHAVRVQPEWKEEQSAFGEVIRQLRAYFGGELKEFDLPLALEGTEFQPRVWESLRTIPYGETISYGQLAVRIGNPKAARAVGLANASNPIPIIIPCHRVIGNDGSLTGFGGGLSTKKKLLALENRQMSLL